MLPYVCVCLHVCVFYWQVSGMSEALLEVCNMMNTMVYILPCICFYTRFDGMYPWSVFFSHVGVGLINLGGGKKLIFFWWEKNNNFLS